MLEPYPTLIFSLLLILPFDVKDLLNETAEGPTLWTVTALNREHGLDRIETKLKGPRRKEMGHSDEVPSLKINLTAVNSTLNYTMAEEVSIFYNSMPVFILLSYITNIFT